MADHAAEHEILKHIDQGELVPHVETGLEVNNGHSHRP
jgi:hypothetical protein